MHDASPTSYIAPPAPPADTSDHDHHDHHHDHIHEPPAHLIPDEPAHHDEPPPSYADAVAISGAPPGYGTFGHYTEDSSAASSEVDPGDRALPEWLGQVLVVCLFLGLVYGFWRFIDSGEAPDDGWPPFGPPRT